MRRRRRRAPKPEPIITCGHCLASGIEPCLWPSGKERKKWHVVRLSLLEADSPVHYRWRGYAGETFCDDCERTVGMDWDGFLAAHPNAKGDQWCEGSHLRTLHPPPGEPYTMAGGAWEQNRRKH